MIKSNHSNYWLSQYVKDTLNDTSFNIFRLANIKQAINNYTKLLSDKNIQIKYSDLKKSFSTQDNVVTISNECDNNIDLTVGIALHEIAHIEYSDFNYIIELHSHLPNIIKNKIKSTHSDNFYMWINNFKFMVNLIEDYRINAFIINKYPGYAPYIDEIKNEYVLNNSISKLLKSKKYNEENWDSYIFRIMYHENPNSNLSILKELKYIISIIDLPNILRLKNIDDSGTVAKKIIEILFNIEYENNTSEQEEQSDIDNPEPVQQNDSVESNSNQHKKNKTIDEYINFINGIEKKKILKNREQSKLIDIINETSSSYKDVKFEDKKIPVLVIKNFTKSLAESGIGIFTDMSVLIENNSTIIQTGINFGKQLVTKLESLNDIKSIKYSYLKKGKIDNRLVNTLGYNNESIFYRDELDEPKTVDFHLSIDLSASMVGMKIENSLICAIALAYTASIINSLNVVIDFRFVTSFTSHNGPCVLIAYDSKKDNIQKIQNLFKYIIPNGSTPEGICFASILDIIKTYNSNEKYFINFSDGMPTYENYAGEGAFAHTKAQVDLIRKENIKVLSYFICEDDMIIDSKNILKMWFEKMYGKDSRFINVTDIIQVTNTLNSKLIEN